MDRSSRARKWARLLGTAALGGVLTAGALAVGPAHADSVSPDGGSVQLWSFFGDFQWSDDRANGVDFESDDGAAEEYQYGFGFGSDLDRANGV